MLFKSSLLAVLATQVLGAFAQGSDAGTSPANGAPQIAADVTTSFPEADIFGVKLVNNRPTKALITISNHDTSSLNVAFVAGSLLSTKPQAEDAPAWQSIVRNLTAVQYAVDVPAGETKELPFSFALDMQPQDVRVQLTAVVMNDKGEIFQVQAADEVAAVVEAPVSFFDPQIIFLYFFILAFFAGIFYFFYTVWIAPYFPQKRRGRESKKAGVAVKKTDLDIPSPDAAVPSATSYNSDWIPAHHIQKPEARKVKGTRSKSRA